MKRIVNKSEAEWRESRDGFPRTVHLMIEPGSAGAERLAMGTEEVAPGSQIPVHVHAEAEEILFVYQGSGRARVGDEEVEVGPDTAIFIPPGTPHGFVNHTNEPVHLTWTFAPPGEQEKFRVAEAWKHISSPPPPAGNPSGGG
ncbi:MAG: cupin domain-containing protein [Candidatus Rokubacteria bacterium]|nr:cupin domain-containing protein [Candidatus Rokubacteria bacterium]